MTRAIKPLAPKDEDDNGRRLIAAARDELVASGMRAATTRAVAARAGMAASAVNYSFGGLEHLFGAALAAGADETEALLSAWLGDFRTAAAAGAPLSAVLCGAIHAWTGEHRNLAVLYQEALAGGARFAPIARRWRGLWEGYWRAAAPAFHAPARLCDLFFQSEALYGLSRWKGPLEAAALQELCDDFCALYGAGAPPKPAAALRAIDSLLAGDQAAGATVAPDVAQAARQIIGAEGLKALTHRAVARVMGRTAGAIAHYAPTAEDLLAAAIQAELDHLRAAAEAYRAAEFGAPATYDAFAAAIGRGLVDPAVDAILAGRRSLFLATTRDRRHAYAGALIRFMQGANVAAMLSELAPDLDHRRRCGRILSRLISAEALDHALTAGADAQRASDRDAFLAPLRTARIGD